MPPSHSLNVSDPALLPIRDKLLADESLSHSDGLTLYSTPDLHGLGRLANYIREKLHGKNTYYNRNRHINYTNVCALSCKFCSFYRKRGEEGAYEMSVEQVIATAVKARDAGASEVHIVGGLHPWLKFDYYLDMLRGIRTAAPTLHIKAFTAIEIIHFSRIAHLNIRDTLIALKEAGLGSLPGGGAEIFDPRVHAEVFKGKVDEHRWFEVHRTAHSLGIFSNATILYGHVETQAERVTHFIKLRNLQQESLDALVEATPASRCSAGRRNEGDAGVAPTNRDAGVAPTKAYFNCCIPLSFIPENSELGHLPGPTGLTDLRTLAIARLMLPQIPHIKAFWIMQGIGLSQLSQNFGVDDVDGTVVFYDITKREGHGTHQELHESDLKRLIRESGHIPVERDTLYHPMTSRATAEVIV